MKNSILDSLNIGYRDIKIIGFVICAIFSLGCAALFGISYSSYLKSQGRFKQKENHLVSLKEDKSNLQELIKEYKEERGRLASLLFSEKDIATFLDNMEAFATKSQVRILEMRAKRLTSVAPPPEISANLPPVRRDFMQGEEKEGPSLVFMPIDMTVEAKFFDLINFLLSLEKYRQLLTVSNVTMERRVYPSLSCRFTLKLYSLKQIEELIR